MGGLASILAVTGIFGAWPSPLGGAGTSAATTASDNAAKVSSLLATSVSGASSSSPFESASQDNISGAATLAAKAAIARVQKDALAKKDEALAKIDSAQAALNSAKSVKKGDGSTIIGNTIIQKYVSWALEPDGRYDRLDWT